VSACKQKRKTCPWKTKTGLLLKFREFIVISSLDYNVNAVLQVETGHKVMVVFVVGILPVINTKELLCQCFVLVLPMQAH